MRIPIHFIETQPQEIHAVCLYTRKQAVAAGRLIDVTITARETGIEVPTFITNAVFETYVAVPEGATVRMKRRDSWTFYWRPEI